MKGKNPPPKEKRRPASSVAKPAELLIQLPLGGRPSKVRQGEPLPSLEYGIDPGGGLTARFGGARFFYVDAHLECRTCGVTFVFTAAEQKHFFEKLLFPLYSAPIHCPACRQLRRGTQALSEAMAAARQELEARPDDPLALLDVAAATLRLYEDSGHGDLAKVIACARKAARKATPSQLGEAAFWEAKAQLLAGRREKAVPLFRLAFEKLPGNQRCAPLREETKEFLAGSPNAADGDGPRSA